jgi:hypothetical protein
MDKLYLVAENEEAAKAISGKIEWLASNDAGATFGDKINLSNTTNADSWRVEIAGEGENVVVSW